MKYTYQFEEWRYIPEYLGYYMVSNFGRVKSLKFGKERILKPAKDGKGYLRVFLCKDGKGKTFKVHRLVAMAFLPNPDNLPQVNHKNEDKSDNRLFNLEWCTNEYNMNYGTYQKRKAERLKGVFINHPKLSKPVNQFTKEGLLIASYPSIREASRQTGFAQTNIVRCCKGGYFDKGKWVNINHSKGYIWKYGN